MKSIIKKKKKLHKKKSSNIVSKWKNSYLLALVDDLGLQFVVYVFFLLKNQIICNCGHEFQNKYMRILKKKSKHIPSPTLYISFWSRVRLCQTGFKTPSPKTSVCYNLQK
jgi:hypothetical protein